MQGIVETDEYLSAADGAGLSEEERDAIALALALDPMKGELMVGTGGARKFRWAGRGKARAAATV